MGLPTASFSTSPYPRVGVVPIARAARARATFVFAFVAAAIVSSCSKPASRPGGSTDDLGKQVVLAEAPRRIVSLAPSLTELLFAIGAGQRVVGRTQWCAYPPEVVSIPSVGDGLNPNVEVIAGLEPDLVVLYASGSNDRALERLAALGIPSINLRMDRLSDVSRLARVLGRITGDSGRADSLVDAFDRGVDEARRSTSPNGATFVIHAWDNPPMVLGATSFLSEIVTLAGGRNVFDDVDQPSLTVSIETIAARQPDLILILGGGEPAWAKRPEWRVLAAVRDKRFVHATGSEFEQPSFRALDAVRRLRTQLEEAKR